MHPVLFVVPLPAWTLPLLWLLLALAAVGFACISLGVRAKQATLLQLGALLAVGGVLSAVVLRDVHIRLEPIPVPAYGALVGLALIAGWYLSLALAEQDGMARSTAGHAYVATALGALVGARLVYVLAHLGDMQSGWEALALGRGGLDAYGAAAGGSMGAYMQLRGSRWLLHWADAVAPSLALGLFLVRVGCYLFGCDFGVPLGSNAPTWIARLGTFPRWKPEVLHDFVGSPAWAKQVASGAIEPTSVTSLPVHPTQLYEALGGLALFFLCTRLLKVRRFHGQVALAVVLGYGVLRFVVELLRGDLDRGELGPTLPLSVLAPLGLLVLGAAFVAGPSTSVRHVRLRWVTRFVVVVGVFVTFVALRSAARHVVVSLAQWCAVLSAIGVAVVWPRSSRSSVALEGAPESPAREDDRA